MKNAPLYALIAAMVFIAILLTWGLYAYFTSGEEGGVDTSLLCGVIVFGVALVVFELAFKRAVIFPLMDTEEE